MRQRTRVKKIFLLEERGVLTCHRLAIFQILILPSPPSPFSLREIDDVLYIFQTGEVSRDANGGPLNHYCLCLSVTFV